MNEDQNPIPWSVLFGVLGFWGALCLAVYLKKTTLVVVLIALAGAGAGAIAGKQIESPDAKII